MALGSIQLLVKMSTRNIPRGKGGRCVRLTSPPSRAECHDIWEPKAPGTLWATPGLLRDSFTLVSFTIKASHIVLCVQRDGRWKEHNLGSGLLRRHLRCVNNYKTTVLILLFIIYITENFWLLITVLIHWQCNSTVPTTDSNQRPTAFQISFQ